MEIHRLNPNFESRHPRDLSTTKGPGYSRHLGSDGMSGVWVVVLCSVSDGNSSKSLYVPVASNLSRPVVGEGVGDTTPVSRRFGSTFRTIRHLSVCVEEVTNRRKL